MDRLSGSMQAYKTPRKSTEDDIKCIRDWASHWGLPYEIKSDNAACFREGWENELVNLGVKVLHSSAYNSQTNGLVERSIRNLKEILVKNGYLSQLMLQEQIYAINCKEDGKTGSATSRFMGKGIGTVIPKSWDRVLSPAETDKIFISIHCVSSTHMFRCISYLKST